VHIDTWLMSCRVLGRRLDELMFAAVTRHAGSRKIMGEFLPTAKNSQVADLYPRLGFVPISNDLFIRNAAIYEPPAMIQCTDLTQP
jgi:predicted enzyme involved in methoxymalonyl-ACP biosynthesis